jgi:hypothetical protein
MLVKYGFRGEGLRKNHSLQKCNIEAFYCFLLYLPVRVFEGEAKGRATCLVWDMKCKPAVFLSDLSLPNFEPSIYADSTKHCLSSITIPHASPPPSGLLSLSSLPPPFPSLHKLEASSLLGFKPTPEPAPPS